MRQSFIYPKERIEKTRQYGSSFFSRPVVNETGDWRKSLPPFEEQRRYGVDPSTCYLFAQLHADATYEEKVFLELDNNYAERFPAQFSQGTPRGGDPLKGSDVIYDYGSAPEWVMPFTEDIKSWEEYHSWKGVDKNAVIALGKNDRLKKRRYGIVIFEKNTPLETKYKLAKEASKRGVVCISVWGVENGDTYAEKPDGVWDTHMVELTYTDEENRFHTLDTYKPFLKALPKNYNPDFGMVRYVETVQEQISVLQKILEAAKSALLVMLQTLKMYQPNVEPPKTPEIAPITQEKTPKELLREYCLESLGEDISPLEDEFACAESVSVILKKIYPDFQPTISTKAMLEILRSDKRFKPTLDWKPWQIVLSPTGYGKGNIPNGHVGIHGEGDMIYSNDSATSLWTQNYTLQTWIDRYRIQGRYPIFLFDV